MGLADLKGWRGRGNAPLQKVEVSVLPCFRRGVLLGKAGSPSVSLVDLPLSGSESAGDRRRGFSLEDRLVPSFRERRHHGLASLEKSAGAIPEHSKAYLCIDLRSDGNLRLCVVAP